MEANLSQKMENILRELVVGCHARDGSNGITQDVGRYEKALKAAETFLSSKELREAKKKSSSSGR
jgi:hypothetical protein